MEAAMKKQRDMTKAEFDAACKRHGFVQEHFGYWKVTGSLRVFPGNAGNRRRDQLAYMIQKRDKHIAKLEREST